MQFILFIHSSGLDLLNLVYHRRDNYDIKLQVQLRTTFCAVWKT